MSSPAGRRRAGTAKCPAVFSHEPFNNWQPELRTRCARNIDCPAQWGEPFVDVNDNVSALSIHRPPQWEFVADQAPGSTQADASHINEQFSEMKRFNQLVNVHGLLRVLRDLNAQLVASASASVGPVAWRKTNCYHSFQLKCYVI